MTRELTPASNRTRFPGAAAPAVAVPAAEAPSQPLPLRPSEASCAARPFSARTVKPWLRSTTWLARAATGKIRAGFLPRGSHQKRRSTHCCSASRGDIEELPDTASSTSGAMHTIRQPAAEPSSVAFSLTFSVPQEADERGAESAARGVRLRNATRRFFCMQS